MPELRIVIGYILNVLSYIFESRIDSKMVFIHIPFAEKISDIDSFFGRIFKAISEF